MLVAATVSPLPRPVLDAAQRVLANRIDLNRAVPDGRALEAAVLKSGVVTTPTTREAPANSKSALLALRTSLLAVLGGDGAAPVEPLARAAPPIKGEPPRAPAPQAALADPAADGPETARTLLGHTDAALSRLKLLQAASQPADVRADASVPRSELRVEIPMLLGTQTGILQLMVEHDGKHKRDQERQRGWRMRFAMNFSETGEVGADIALLRRQHLHLGRRSRHCRCTGRNAARPGSRHPAPRAGTHLAAGPPRRPESHPHYARPPAGQRPMSDTPDQISLAVALDYERGSTNAPRVVAKGRGELARAIVEVAAESGVVIDANGPLAEALAGVELDEPIPIELYEAVAEVIGFVLRASAQKRWKP